MNFAEAEKYLISLGNEVETMKLGLDNIRALLTALGDPQTNYLKVQIAGTNGKGSVCAFLDSICREAGIRTGLFTSPHLISITERIRIAGNDVSEEEFAALATHVRTTSERLVSEGKLATVPTYFEQVTAMALLAFAENKVELGILETGLGGRFDATTAANAEVAAITPISLDHQEYLGNTLSEIAAEKAAIIRPDSVVIVAPQASAAKRAIEGHCRQIDVEPHLVTAEVSRTKRPNDENDDGVFNTGRIQIRTARATYVDVVLGLWGEHQWMNAGVAVELAETLRDLGFRIGSEQIREGLRIAKHPGRLEYVGVFLLDGAHNAAGAEALKEFLTVYNDRPITLIFGAMRDKDIGKIANILFPLATTIIFTKACNSRSIEPADLVEYLPDGFDKNEVVVADSLEHAITLAPYRSLQGQIVVTGSLYLVGEVKRILANSY